MKRHFLGFKFWTTAVQISIQNENLNLKMMDLYGLIAKKHKTTAQKVERDMRYCWKDMALNNIFEVDYKINNTALLLLIKDEVIEKIDAKRNIKKLEKALII